jgi:hypothetical protein
VSAGAAGGDERPAAVKRGVTSSRWQYQVVDIGIFNTGSRLTAALGRLGSEGWELVAMYDKASNWLTNMEKGFAIFRREVLGDEEPDGPWAVWIKGDGTHHVSVGAAADAVAGWM